TLGRRLADALPDVAVTRCPTGGLADWTATHFASGRVLVFIGSVGLAVRAIAPHVASKTTDPAVVVVDETGRFAVPILSGHIGQANTWARRIAQALGAEPVVTTATDSRGVFAVDDWATRLGLKIANPERIKAVSAALLAGRTVRLASEFPIAGPPPAGVVPDPDRWDVIVSCRQAPADALHLVPPAVTAGIGCRRGTREDVIERAFGAALDAAGYHPASVAQVCSIDLKAREPGLVAFCERRGLPLRTFSAEELGGVQGAFGASDFVAATVGVDNVCERAAALGSGGYLVAAKAARDGVTVALALREPRLRFDALDLGDSDQGCDQDSDQDSAPNSDQGRDQNSDQNQDQNSDQDSTQNSDQDRDSDREVA
ncbi:MAG: cobalamin biosynthesis protein, partial [Propionibacteriaceae bacterium]|nr:cobalamin biosynthesis protein [Propionibacteriaceae bacterium]